MVVPIGPVSLQHRKRTSTPRSKNGCTSCRQYKVKCNEVRPVCGRCVTLANECTYADSRTHGNILPSGSQAIQSGTPDEYDTLQVDAYCIPFTVPGPRSQRKALHYFNVCIAPEFAGYLSTDFWDRFVLQRCQHEACLRVAATALSRMHLEYVRAESIFDDENWDISRCEALEAYDKALRSLRMYMTRPNKTSETVVLLCCAMFFCIEIMSGHPAAACTHLTKGAEILRSWSKRLPTGHRYVRNDDLGRLVEVFGNFDLKACVLDNQREPHFRFWAADQCLLYPSWTEMEQSTSMLGIKRRLLYLSNGVSAFVSREACRSTGQCERPRLTLLEEKRELQGNLELFLLEVEHLERSLRLSTSQLRKQGTQDSRQLADATFIASVKVHHCCLTAMMDDSPECKPSGFDRVSTSVLQLSEEIINVHERLRIAPTFEGARRSFSPEVGIAVPLLLTAFNTADEVVKEKAQRLVSTFGFSEGHYFSPGAKPALCASN